MARTFTLIKGEGGQDSPLDGFDQCSSIREQVYLLQVKTGSAALDNALYRRAHNGGKHEDVIDVLRFIAETYSDSTLANKARELADTYTP